MPKRIPLTSVPTISELYRLGRLASGVTGQSSQAVLSSLNDKIGLITGDITTIETDAIVNAANQSLLGGSGVDGAIHRAAGPSLVEECRTLHSCETGSAKITKSYNLPCKRVIHTVGPVYPSTKKDKTHTALLKSCYRTSLQLAVENSMRTVAFPSISTGVYGYPIDEAAEEVLQEVKSFLEGPEGANIHRVVFCCFAKRDEEAYLRLIPKYFSA